MRHVTPAPERRQGGGRLRRLATSLEGSGERARRSGSSQTATESTCGHSPNDRNNRVVGGDLTEIADRIVRDDWSSFLSIRRIDTSRFVDEGSSKISISSEIKGRRVRGIHSGEIDPCAEGIRGCISTAVDDRWERDEGSSSVEF